MAYALNTINQRLINVAMKIGNRQDLLQPAPGSNYNYSRIAGWLRDAYIAIAACRSFEQAEQTTQFTTVQGQDTYLFPAGARAIKSIEGYRPDGTPVQVEYKNMQYIRRYNAGTLPGVTPTQQGPPSIYTYWGSTIIFRPVPDSTVYTFFLDSWLWPNITSDIVSTILQVPMEWLEIIDYEAAVRGNAELQQSDRSREMQELLYGFKDPATGRFTPGIIERMQNRDEAQKPFQDYGIQPKYNAPYTG
jgi:hypothetical protein